METKHSYRVVAWWSSGRTGLAKTAIAEYSKFEYSDLEVQVEGSIEKVDSGYAFTEIVIRPNLSVTAEEDEVRGMRLLQKTKTLCLVSRALSVSQTFDPHLQVNQANKANVLV